MQLPKTRLLPSGRRIAITRMLSSLEITCRDSEHLFVMWEGVECHSPVSSKEWILKNWCAQRTDSISLKSPYVSNHLLAVLQGQHHRSRSNKLNAGQVSTKNSLEPEA